MNYEKKEIKKGIDIHNISTNKYKTNLYAVFLATPINRENVTKNALITAILRRGTQNLQSQDIISKKLEEMYGATFDCGIEKTGDNHIMKFYLEAISEEFLPEKEELAKKCIEILLDIIFNPLIENNGFKDEYVESEKNNLKQIIESKIDNKRTYSLERCVEEMFKDEPYGLYKYGYVEDLDKLTPQNLYEYYKELINQCKIDIFVSETMADVADDVTAKIVGTNSTEDNTKRSEMAREKINNIIEQNDIIKTLKEREPVYVKSDENNNHKEVEQEKVVEEHMQVGQGNLVIGLKVNSNKENAKYITSVYNAILGGGANSKLFQNVREKESLAYTAASNYRRQKNVIFIRCGIEIENYKKAIDTIKVQLEDIKSGNFTEEDLNNSKKLIIESIRGISSEQDTEITYYYGQELSNKLVSLEEYVKKIEKVTKKDVEEIANEIRIDTIYFLRD